MKENNRFIPILIAAILLIIWGNNGHAQSVLYIGSGATFHSSGTNIITLDKVSFENNGTFNAGTSSIIMKENGGSSDLTIGGSSSTTFHNLNLDLQSQNVQLLHKINVNGNVAFIKGKFDLNGFDCDLGVGGSIVGEAENSRFFGTAGQVILTADLNAPGAANPGNIGLLITSAENLGTTIIRRGHAAHAAGSSNSLERYFEIAPTNNSNLNASLMQFYFDSELNGNEESLLVPWKDDGSGYKVQGFSARNSSSNFVELTGISSFGSWMLSEEICPTSIVTCYFDGDGDGYGLTSSPMNFCDVCAAGYALQDGDCNDGNAAVNPGATEICDGTDNNCNSLIDVDDPNLVDNTPPSITCPTNISVVNVSGACGAVVNYAAVTASDNCTGVSVSQIAGLGSGATFPVGVTTESYTATDVGGNETLCSFTVTVVDNEDPIASCLNATVQLDASGNGSITASDIDNGSSDNCGIQSLSLDKADFTLADLGPNTITLTVTDPSGNSSNCTATVDVLDPVEGYVLVATNGHLEFDESINHAGGIGVMSDDDAEIKDNALVTAPSTFVKAPNIIVDNSSSVTIQIVGEANPILPTFRENTTNPNNNVDVDNGETVILTESVYRGIKVKNGATIIFSGNSDVFIKDLETKDNVTVLFDQCTNLMFSNEVNLGADGLFNPDQMDVTVFVENDIHIKKRNEVYGTFYTQGKFETKKSSSSDPTQMNGSFIGEKVDIREFGEFWYQEFDPVCPLLLAGQLPISYELDGTNQPSFSEATTITNMKGIGTASVFRPYPNPARDEIRLSANGHFGKAARVRIFNMQGRMMVEQNYPSLENKEIVFYLERFTDGMYTIMISIDGDAPISKKFIIQK